MKLYVILELSCLIALGCATARSDRYARAPQYPPTDPATIQFYHVEPDEPYERLGEIAYNGMAIASWSGAEKLLREKASAMGADAVLVLQSGSYVSGYTPAVGSYAWSQAGGTGSGAGTYVGGQPVHRKAMFALAIKFKQNSATASPPDALAEAEQFVGVQAARRLKTSTSVAPASDAPSQGVYHRFFVMALCSDCAGREVERLVASGLNSNQVPTVCPAELSDHPDQSPDQMDVDSLCHWLYAKGFDGLIVIAEPEGDSWKGKIALELVDTAKHVTIKLYPVDNTLHNLSSVSDIGRLFGQWLRQDGYFVER